MLRKLISGKIESITAAALLVALSSLASRFLGVFRDRILAGEFGAGDTLDAYYAAFRIPDLVFNLLVLGAISAGFVPIFTSLLKNKSGNSKKNINSWLGRDNTHAWEMAGNIINLIGISLIILCGLGIIFSPWLVKVITPGFGADKLALTINLSRIMFLSPIFLGISSIFGGILQSFKRFFIYSLSPIVYNIGIIIGAVYFVPLWGVIGLGWGVVFGAFFHMIIQVPIVFKLGFNFNFNLGRKSKHVRKIMSLMLPRTMSLAVTQINFIVITIISSTLAGGSLAIFNFANNLQFLPISLFGISFAIAAFPVFSETAFDRKKLVQNFSKIFRQILFFIVPSTVLLLTLRAQIVRVVLGAGKFNWEDTILTIDTLSFFTVSLFAQASIPLLVRVFYARHNTKTPFVIGLISIIMNIILAVYLSQRLGVAGLALAFSASSIVNFILLWLTLRLELGDMDENRVLYSAIKFSISAIACGLAVQGVERLISEHIDMSSFWEVFLHGSAAGSAGILVYLAFNSLLKSEELFHFYSVLRFRFFKKNIN